MKLSCLQENLNRGLSVVQRAVATRTPLPITGHVLLATDQSRLKLVATNLELAISCWIVGKIDEEGAITVPARLLTEFVGSLPADKVDFTLTPKTRTLNLKCARFEARMNGMDAADFPPVPKVEGGISIKIDPEAFRQAIRQVAFAAAVEESRPVLTGVDVIFEDKTMILAAADGFRLAVYKLPLDVAVPEKVEVIIPARTLDEVARLSEQLEKRMVDKKGPDGHMYKSEEAFEPIEVMVNPTKSQVLFRLKNLHNNADVEVVSQLVQGSFPKYGQLIPQTSTTRAMVEKQHFLQAVKTAAIFARDGSGIVRIIVGPGAEGAPGKLSISARSEEVGEDSGEIDAVTEGPEAKIAFNGKYLMDALSVLKESQVSLEVTTPSSPGVIKPVGSDNYVHVVMPMFVQW